ncbi:response regulator [Curtobacterium sp. SGAir0471]|uniref:response regulator n=1 Tax=Curtobacterium sp. SGAir0471 TaxID=2070337 RepID=UPI0020C8133E|nr:response regulator transcription factor [Curtobacterium sp. SGAir0471]
MADVTVFLVEDQALLRTATAMLVGAQPGLRLVGDAADGDTAIERVTRLRPQVVLMDIRMPGTDGIAATRQITATTDSRVLLLTSFETDDNVLAGSDAGASGFLPKETEPAELARAVHAVAEGAAFASPHATNLLLERARLRGVFRPASSPPFELLSDREREVALLVARGLSNAEISRALFISEATVKTHVARTLRVYGLRSRVQVAVLAHRSGWVDD